MDKYLTPTQYREHLKGELEYKIAILNRHDDERTDYAVAVLAHMLAVEDISMDDPGVKTIVDQWIIGTASVEQLRTIADSIIRQVKADPVPLAPRTRTAHTMNPTFNPVPIHKMTDAVARKTVPTPASPQKTEIV